MNSEDVAFAGYRRTGQPERLAAVFDATVAELLRVACYLAPERSVAEDLVQSTFLLAIEHRDRYDESQPVLPWLLGILANVARHERRKRRPPPVTGANAPGIDPVTAAIASELQTRCAEALRGLPQPYRQVLLLRLEHGLDTAAIAEVTGSKQATVRTWIARGMDLLRRSLPVGVAGGMAVSARAANVDAEVVLRLRAAVLPSLPASLAVSTVVAAGTSIAMKKTLVCLSLGLALLAGWLALPDLTTTSAMPSTDAVGQARGGAAGADAVVLAASGDSTAADPLRRVAVDPERSVLRVRLVRENGSPLPAAVVHVAVEGLAGASEQRTDADGWTTFAELPAAAVVVVGSGRGPTRSLLLAPGDNEVLVTLPALVEVHGRVVDRQQVAVAGADVYVVHPGHRDGVHWLARSDAAGAFIVDGVAPGSVLVARAAGWQPSSVQRGGRIHETTRSVVETTLVMGERAEVVSGRVLGPDGEPAAGAELLFAVGEDRREHSGGNVAPRTNAEAGRGPDRELLLVRADASGRFSVHEVPSGQVLVLARSAVGRLPGAAMRVVEVAAGGRTTCDVVLAPAAVIHGVVQDERGEPFSGVVLQSEWRGPESLGRLEGAWADALAASSRTDERGRFVLAPLWPGQVRLRPAEARSAELGRIELHAGEHRHVDFVLPRRLEVAVRVLGPDGAPIRGVGLWIDKDPAPTPRRSVLLGQRTGEDGRCLVRNAPTDGPWHVVLFAPVAGDADDPLDRMPSRVFVVSPTTSELTLRLDATDLPTASLVARFVDAHGAQVPVPSITLRRAGWREVRRFRGGGEQIVVPSLASGTYWLDIGSDLAFGPFELQPGQRMDVGSLNVEAFGRLRVRLRDAGGAPIRTGQAVLLGDEIRSERQLQLVDGELVHERVAAGRRRLLVFAPGFAATEVDVELPVGAETVREVVIDAGFLQPFVLAPDVLVGAEVVEFTLHREGGRVQVASGVTSDRRFQLPLRRGNWVVRFGQPGRGMTPQSVIVGSVAVPPIVLRGR